jgi:hypothetical protein
MLYGRFVCLARFHLISLLLEKLEADGSHSMRATLFVSYSHQNFDREKLNYFLEQVKRKARSQVKILIDLRDVRLGGSFSDYMSLLDDHEVDAVLIALTPSYKDKVQNNEGSVPREFSSILSRYHDDRNRVAESKVPLEMYEEVRRFGLLPIIISGTPANAIPTPISQLRYYDISSTIIFKDHEEKMTIPNLTARQEVDRLAEALVAELKAITKTRPETTANDEIKLGPCYSRTQRLEPPRTWNRRCSYAP